MDLVALKVELDAGHPVTGAYDVDDALAAEELNATNLTRIRTTVTGSEVFNATDDSEYTILSASEKDSWLRLCGIDDIDISNGIAKSLEDTIFGQSTATRSNLISLKTESVSRTTQLGFSRVRSGTVESARAL